MDEQQTFGNYLRKERKSREISLSEVSMATRIPLHTLQSLEDGAWENLPAKVFVKGFVKSYANHIGLSAEETCSLYTEGLNQLILQRENQGEPVGQAATDVGGNRRFGVALFVLILIIIATITFSILWRTGPSADTHAGARMENSGLSSLT